MKLLPALTSHLLHLSGTHWPCNPTPLPTTHPSREKSTYHASLNKAITLSWNAQNHGFLGGGNGLYQIVLLSPNHLICFYHMCDEKNSRGKGGFLFFVLVLLLIYTGKWEDSPSPEGFCSVHKATYSSWIATVGVKALQQRTGQFKPNNNLTLSQVRQCPQAFSASVTARFLVCSQMADLGPLLSTGHECHAVTSLRFGIWKTEVRKMHFSSVLITVC